MKQLELLDCTLRDGGYINNWAFPFDYIKETLQGLVNAGIDIIECGYISQKHKYSPHSTYFSDIKHVTQVLPSQVGNSKFVVMINFGDYELDAIPNQEEANVDGIRLAFHKRNRMDAITFSKGLIEKGYKVFLQPMVALSYTDEEFLDLIRRTNEIQPHAFYIVDSFGAMKADDVLHLFYMIDYNLDSSIRLGFHSHNNLQLSYSHAQMLSNQQTDRTIVIDCSIMGIGRGAGNLNTELFAEYVNCTTGSQYKIPCLLEVMDHVITPIYQNKYWGYSLPHYLSATHNCHPNYATYLDDKNTLTFKNIHEIFDRMAPEKKINFDEEYIQELYMAYQSKISANITEGTALQEVLEGKEILILAPGRSMLDEQEQVRKFIIEHQPIVIAINFVPDDIQVDYVFVSNLRRWEAVREYTKLKVIVTSNLDVTGIDMAEYFVADYKSLLNTQDKVKDNAGMMLLAFLIQMKAKKIYLAGVDGYSTETESNFVRSNLEFYKKPSVMTAMNTGMTAVITQYSKKVPIEFLTTPRYVRPTL